MADQKLTALTETTSPATTDDVYIVTTPGGTPASKRCTIANLRTSMAVGMIKIAQVVVGVGGATTIDFSSIPATYESLRIVAMVRNDKAAVAQNDCWLTMNNDGGANYDMQWTTRNASSTSGSELFGQVKGYIGTIAATTATANVATQIDILIAGYARTVFQKDYFSNISYKQNESSAGLFVTSIAGFWRSTAAINQVTLLCTSDKFVQGSVATLYGIS